MPALASSGWVRGKAEICWESVEPSGTEVCLACAPATACCLSDASHSLAALDSRGALRVLQLSNKRSLALHGHTCAGTAVGFVQLGRGLVAGFKDGTLLYYPYLKPCSPIYLRGHDSQVLAVQPNDARQQVLSCSATAVIVHDLQAGHDAPRRRFLPRLPQPCKDAQWAAAGRCIVTLHKDGVIRSWDGDHPKLGRPLDISQTNSDLDPVGAMTVVPDGRRVVGLHASGALSCWTAAPAPADAPSSTQVAWKHTKMNQHVQGSMSQPGASQLAWLGGKGESLAVVCPDGAVRCFPTDSQSEQPWQLSNLQAGTSIVRLSCSPKGSIIAALTTTGKVWIYGHAAKTVQRKPLKSIQPMPCAPCQYAHQDRHQNAPHAPRARKQPSRSDRKVQEASLQVAMLGQPEAAVNSERLADLLTLQGEFPSKYRPLIWEFLLQLPRNSAAYQELAHGPHGKDSTRFDLQDLRTRYPGSSHKHLLRLARLLRTAAAWSPVFGEAEQAPALISSFVHLFGSCELVAFEAFASVVRHWMPDWYGLFPDPPAHMLLPLERLLARLDPTLHHVLSCGRPAGACWAIWQLLSTLCSGPLSWQAWMRAWDHILISRSPAFPPALAVCLLRHLRQPLLCSSPVEWPQILSQDRLGNAKKIIREAESVMQHAPELAEMRQRPAFTCLPHGHYPDFHGAPASSVHLQRQERLRIQAAEQELQSKRQAATQMELRAAELAQQHQALALAQQRAAEMRAARLEADRTISEQREQEQAALLDTARQDRLRRLAANQAATAQHLQALETETQLELQEMEQRLAQQDRQAIRDLQEHREMAQLQAMEWQAARQAELLSMQAKQAAAKTARQDEAMAKAAQADADRQQQLLAWSAEDSARQAKQELQAQEAERRAVAQMDAAAAARQTQLEQLLRQKLELQEAERERQQRLAAEDAAAAQLRLEMEGLGKAQLDAAQDEALIETQMAASAACLEHGRSQRLALKAAAEAAAASQQAANSAIIQAEEDAARQTAIEAQLLHHRAQLEALDRDEARVFDADLEYWSIKAACADDAVVKAKSRGMAVRAGLDAAKASISQHQEMEGQERAATHKMLGALSLQARETEARALLQHEDAMAAMLASQRAQESKLSTANRLMVQRKELATAACLAIKRQKPDAKLQTQRQRALQSSAHEVAKLRKRTLQAERMQRNLASHLHGSAAHTLSTDWHSDASDGRDSSLSIRTEEMSSDSASSCTSSAHLTGTARQFGVQPSDTESSMAYQ
ncbi:hypothetical protein WJX74_001198 [Apatococcus lobatus]|uniref:TBC1 domain family member 31 n=1 Tax=Apatococcus lobatus TaxID=904363 RepID=A0AAW1QYN1_9CHLO